MSVEVMGGAQGPAPAVEAVGLCRSYGSTRALDFAELAVPRGGITALVGPPGAGKTTLLMVLASLLTADSGKATVLGVDPARDPQRVRRRLGWLPARGGTFAELTVAGSLRAIAAAHGMRPAAAQARVAELMAATGLEHAAARRTRLLSAIDTRRLALAQALVHSPEVLLADDPTAGLAPDDRHEAHRLLRALGTGGTTLLVTSRNLDGMTDICDRALHMQAGRVVAGQDMTREAGQLRWRVLASDVERLRLALDEAGAPFDETPASAGDSAPVRAEPGEQSGRGALDITVADEADAVALMHFLAARSVPVVAFGPVDSEHTAARMSIRPAPATNDRTRS